MGNIINVEFKAKCYNPEHLFNQLIELKADYKGEDHQIDTYFETTTGRLKLREGSIEKNLIYYNRENLKGSKTSKIILDRPSPDSNIKKILELTNEVKAIVDKKRKILFIDNVKFHIDNVKGLGSFMEVEAIDADGKRTESELKDQCDYYQKLLGINDDDMQSISYSDMLMQDFRHRVEVGATNFLRKLFQFKTVEILKLDDLFMDHICFRTGSEEEYQDIKTQFQKIGKLLVASEIGGREISTFKLNTPIIFGKHEIELIEVPAPKPGKNYVSGYEHAEFVIKESFQDYIDNYSEIDFDTSSCNKTHNPELRVKLAKNISIKLHHQSLEDVIKEELS